MSRDQQSNAVMRKWIEEQDKRSVCSKHFKGIQGGFSFKSMTHASAHQIDHYIGLQHSLSSLFLAHHNSSVMLAFVQYPCFLCFICLSILFRKKRYIRFLYILLSVVFNIRLLSFAWLTLFLTTRCQTLSFFGINISTLPYSAIVWLNAAESQLAALLNPPSRKLFIREQDQSSFYHRFSCSIGDSDDTGTDKMLKGN